jgi:hypothetical protein
LWWRHFKLWRTLQVFEGTANPLAGDNEAPNQGTEVHSD